MDKFILRRFVVLLFKTVFRDQIKNWTQKCEQNFSEKAVQIHQIRKSVVLTSWLSYWLERPGKLNTYQSFNVVDRETFQRDKTWRLWISLYWEDLLSHCLKRFSAIKLKTGPRNVRNVISLKYKDKLIFECKWSIPLFAWKMLFINFFLYVVLFK